MRRSRLVVAAVLLLLGLFWIGQGSGMIAGGFMSGNSFWEGVGIVLAVGGLVIGAREFIRRPVARP